MLFYTQTLALVKCKRCRRRSRNQYHRHHPQQQLRCLSQPRSIVEALLLQLLSCNMKMKTSTKMYLSIVLSTLCILFYQYQLSKAMSSGNVDHIENNEVATLTRSTTASTTTIKTTSTTTSLPFQTTTTTTTTTERTVTKFKSYEENNSFTELTVIPIVLLEPDLFFYVKFALAWFRLHD